MGATEQFFIDKKPVVYSRGNAGTVMIPAKIWAAGKASRLYNVVSTDEAAAQVWVYRL
jgi:hypothetical protein